MASQRSSQMAVPPMIGSYRIERLLGAGSFATVWLGFDPALGGRVAIKVLAENWSHDLRVRERFLQEARLLFQLDNPRLVRVHAVGELPDGRPYSVMDWADGGSLRELLAAGPVDEGLELLGEIAAGVAVLHRHRVVHRDLSPGNVLFRTAADPDLPRLVLIADLGLAKALAAASGLTARAGTPGFMSPEQNDALAVVDTRADVYGLGRLGFALLGDNIPAAVRNVLRRATEMRPQDRYRDAAAFASALDSAGKRRNTPAYARRRLPLILGVLAAVVVVGIVPSDVAIKDPGVRKASDSTGRITVTLPPGWHASGSGWAGRPGVDGRLEPALVVSPDPRHWPTDPAVPGAFVGVSDLTATPAGFVAQRLHASCVAVPVRRSQAAGIDWVIARFTCADGKPMIIEAAGMAGASGPLVYLQIAAPPDEGLVNALLAGITIH